MINQMKQQQAAGMQGQFDSLAERSINQSGVKPDANNPVQAIGSMVAGAIVATVESAKQNGKSVPPDVVLQSAMNLSLKLLSGLGLSNEQMEPALAEVFLTAMELLLAMGKGIISDQEMKLYEQFIQQLLQAAKGQAPQGQAPAPQQAAPQQSAQPPMSQQGV